MLVSALSIATAVAAAELPGAAEIFEEQATSWLLEGRGLPPDYRLTLMAMEPTSRLQAIVFLRRSGLLTGESWSLEDLLRPVTGAKNGASE